jgi:N-acetyl sugar amidotransferase
MSKYGICTRCIMDTSDPMIVFDEDGVCNHCRKAERLLKSEPFSLSNAEKEKRLRDLASEIKEHSKGRKYDCIIGVSGGADSTYAAYLVKKIGLNPLAVHLDNGWDSRLAVTNIEKTLKKLGIDLYTYVIDWEEFRDLQLSFLKASTPDSEVPSDHAITAILYRMAEQYNIKYILAGTNISTESILPAAWSHGHSDWKYIHRLQQKFGTARLRTFPHYSLWQLMRYIVFKKIKFVSILNYTDYIKEDAVKMLTAELDWEYYGGKHHESKYTQFYQAYILPQKFGFDKRRAHLSSLIMAGQISRDKALDEMKAELYPLEKLHEDKEYVINKFSITENEFEAIMDLPVKRFSDYPSYEHSFYYKVLMGVYRMLGKFGMRKIDF